jgi:hypothetical protein
LNTYVRLRRYLFATALLAIFFISFPIDNVNGQAAAHLTVTITGQSLTAGFNNTVVVTVLNNYYSASYPNTGIYDVDVAITVPSGLSMFGDNHWHYDSIELGQSITIRVKIYAPNAAIGSSYQGSISATYRQLGNTAYTQETHSFSLSVYGWINLILYGVLVTPTVTSPGGNATVSGNLLNGGNLAAYNANVTVLSDALAPGSVSSVYIGEIDPNIPRPFSIFVPLKPGLPEGNYTVIVKVTAIDSSRPGSPFVNQQTSQIRIRKPTAGQQNPRQREGGIIGVLLEILRNLFETFFGSPTSSPSFGPAGSTPSQGPVVIGKAYSYFKATTAFILEARHAG